MKTNPAEEVTVFEVGPRDGLQNESEILSSELKVEFIQMLAAANLPKIEATSFVRPGVIPQLSDAHAVYTQIQKIPACTYSALTPNSKGVELALEAGVQEGAVFTAPSETFTRKNINCTVAESFQRFEQVMELAVKNAMPVRGYISMVVECPYEGSMAPAAVLEICQRLSDLGVYEISLGDTIGAAVPEDIARLLDVLLAKFPAHFFAGHFHDTRATALCNVYQALQYGLRTFDSSAGGLGGCPYAPGAAGNLATEDLVYSMERSGYRTGVDLYKVARASGFIAEKLGKQLPSRVCRTLLSHSKETEVLSKGQDT